MTKKLNLKVNGNDYEVTVGDLHSSPVTVNVNGKDFSVEFVEAGSTAAPSTLVSSFTPAPLPAKPAAPGAAVNLNAITAPMPGTILDIAVKPGDTVAVGTLICALEAMKMKNMIKSPRAGKVSCVEVSSGQKVGHGAVIIRFEE
jgi:glutaconyl-CoA/methylmalonyl-CoA decarboxylase subunit gamma